MTWKPINDTELTLLRVRLAQDDAQGVYEDVECALVHGLIARLDAAEARVKMLRTAIQEIWSECADEVHNSAQQVEFAAEKIACAAIVADDAAAKQ